MGREQVERWLFGGKSDQQRQLGAYSHTLQAGTEEVIFRGISI